MSEHPIAFERLTRYYGATKALDSLTLAIPKGSISALLGRNGAGKTTAIRCLLGLLEPTRGRALLLGSDSARLPASLRARVGYVAEGHELIPWMRVSDLVSFQKGAFPGFDDARCRAMLKRLGIPESRRVARLSRGMRAQVALALALAPRPEVVILDDPATGLDAVVRREFLEAMIDLIQEEGRTLLFSSHILQDVERVADRVAILHEGVLRVDAPLDEAKRRIRRWRASFDAEPPPLPSLQGLVRGVRRRNEWLLTLAAPEGVEARLRACGAARIEEEAMSLEDLFVEYTSKAGAE